MRTSHAVSPHGKTRTGNERQPRLGISHVFRSHPEPEEFIITHEADNGKRGCSPISTTHWPF